MTREEFYNNAKFVDEVESIVCVLEIIDSHLLGAKKECNIGKYAEERDKSDFSHMVDEMFLHESYISVFLKEYYNFLDNLLTRNEKNIGIGDKNLLEAVKKRSLETFAPEEIFIARDKFLLNLKKALEEVLAAIQLPKAEEK